MKNTVLVQVEIITKNDDDLTNREVERACKIIFKNIKSLLQIDNDMLYRSVQKEIKNGILTKIRVAN